MDCIEKSVLRNRVEKTYQIIPNHHSKIAIELLRESHEMPNEWRSKFQEHSAALIVEAKLLGAWSLNSVTLLSTMWTDRRKFRSKTSDNMDS